MSAESEKEILDQTSEKESSVTKLKDKIHADLVVRYLVRYPGLQNAEEGWERKYAAKLENLMRIHLEHSDPDYWRKDPAIYKSMLEILESELYGEEEKAA